MVPHLLFVLQGTGEELEVHQRIGDFAGLCAKHPAASMGAHNEMFGFHIEHVKPTVLHVLGAFFRQCPDRPIPFFWIGYEFFYYFVARGAFDPLADEKVLAVNVEFYLANFGLIQFHARKRVDVIHVQQVNMACSRRHLTIVDHHGICYTQTPRPASRGSSAARGEGQDKMSAQEGNTCRKITESDADYLRDESRFVGWADGIAFPESEQEMRAVLMDCTARGFSVTCQGSRTGITGGAVPRGGCVLNLSRMNRVVGLGVNPATGRFTARVQPGVLLRDLREQLRARALESVDANPRVLADFRSGPNWEFPPDPTESSASLGGMTACNASGARSFRYGAVRRYVIALRVVLADGRLLVLRRGVQRAEGRQFVLATQEGSRIRGNLPSYSMPAVKNAAGYYALDNMDLVDLFVGSEGTLGVVTEVELELIPEAPLQWGVMIFLPQESSVSEAVAAIRKLSARWSAIEFFDARALEFLRAIRLRVAALQTLPELKREWQSALYVELDATDEDEAMAAMDELSEQVAALGVSDEATWTAMNERAMTRLRELRHALPEQINARIDELRRQEPAITKLGTDLAVPDDRLADALALYRAGICEHGFDAVQFGHIGNNHIHVNILARNKDEYERGQQVYLEWARQVIAWGGTISAEHGVGKLKVDLLREMYGEQGIREMLAVKKAFDPELRLGPGTLFG